MKKILFFRTNISLAFEFFSRWDIGFSRWRWRSFCAPSRTRRTDAVRVAPTADLLLQCWKMKMYSYVVSFFYNGWLTGNLLCGEIRIKSGCRKSLELKGIRRRLSRSDRRKYKSTHELGIFRPRLVKSATFSLCLNLKSQATKHFSFRTFLRKNLPFLKGKLDQFRYVNILLFSFFTTKLKTRRPVLRSGQRI